MDNLADVVLAAALAAGLVYLALRRAVLRGEAAIEALRANEARFRHLTELSADWFWESDPQHRIVWLSGGASLGALFGSELAYGRRIWDVPGVRLEPAGFAEHLERLAGKDAQLPVIEFELRRGDGGAERVHVVSGRPRYDAAGAFAGYRGVARDITDVRRAERALGEAKERLERATESGDVAIWDADLESRTVYLGAGWTRLLGDRAEPSTSGMDELVALVHPADLPRAVQAGVETMKGERAEYVVEHRVRTHTGDWRLVLSRGRVTARDPASGRALRMSGVNLDITERRRAEQAVRDAEERYRSLVELAPDAVLVHSGRVIEYANTAAVRLLRAGSAQRLLGMNVEALVHPDQLDRLRERLGYLEAGPGRSEFEGRRLLCLDGTECLVEAAGVSYIERGRLVVQTVLRDVGGQRERREALAERERRFRDVVEVP